jgi:hypothetical protein
LFIFALFPVASLRLKTISFLLIIYVTCIERKGNEKKKVLFMGEFHQIFTLMEP